MGRTFELSRRLFLIGTGAAVATAAAAGTTSSLIIPAVAPIIRRQVTSLELPDGVERREIIQLYASGRVHSPSKQPSRLGIGRPDSARPILELLFDPNGSPCGWRAGDTSLHGDISLTPARPVVYLEWENVPWCGGVIMIGTIDYLGARCFGWLHTFHFDYDGSVGSRESERWSLAEADGGILRELEDVDMNARRDARRILT